MTLVEPNRELEIGNHKSDEVIVAVRGLTKVFKDFWGRPEARAVDDVDFDVRRGARNLLALLQKESGDSLWGQVRFL